VQVGIETDRGPWVAALIAADYTVFPVNPLQASRYRGRHGVSGAKSDGGDAHMWCAPMRISCAQRPVTARRPASPTTPPTRQREQTHGPRPSSSSATCHRLIKQLPPGQEPCTAPPAALDIGHPRQRTAGAHSCQASIEQISRDGRGQRSQRSVKTVPRRERPADFGRLATVATARVGERRSSSSALLAIQQRIRCQSRETAPRNLSAGGDGEPRRAALRSGLRGWLRFRRYRGGVWA
jgi:hypothetical protein